ncbi:tyrosine-protein phosphatase [Spirosoma soli]|uniref:protein-tyrosine-phosphatase n=1 Tax=Spirosoma soli TaxID=1770529 RepID=A0ABW5M175_9BACT
MLNKRFWQRLIPNRKAPTRQSDACFWQVDIHSHLIPNLDDGVSDPDEAVTCLKQLADWGIRKVITTPHVSRDWYPNTTTAIQEGLAALQTIIAEHELPITVDVAAEYLLDDFFPDRLNTGDLLTFGAQRYLLIETGWSAPPLHLDDILFRIQTRGYTPVLAHPERYKYYHDNKQALTQLRETGCRLQLNWMSLTGRYGSSVEKQARHLLHEHSIDFIGSDMHKPSDLNTMERLLNPTDLKLIAEQPLLNQSLID